MVDPHGSVFRVLRGLDVELALCRVDDARALEAFDSAEPAILGVYGEPDWDELRVLASLRPTVVFAVMARADHAERALAAGAIAYASDRVPGPQLRRAIHEALVV